jgi:phospholipid-binding lipoprotein MlaA
LRSAPVIVVLAFTLGGCGTTGGMLRADSVLPAPPPPPSEAGIIARPPALPPPASDDGLEPSAILAAWPPLEPRDDARALVAQAQESRPDAGEIGPDDEAMEEEVEEEYDPWEPFNEKMFELNRRIDRYFLKPVATAYSKVIPEPLQVLVANGFDNIAFVPRFVNSLLQGKLGGAGREVSRFAINSTLGMGGLFDPAKDYWGIDKSREDFGQTLGAWGSGPGPYLILPLLPPLTVRDGIGRGVDGFLNPLTYVLPFFWERLALTAGEQVNERALNLELYEGFEESVLDLYSAVRHGYLRRREQLIRE